MSEQTRTHSRPLKIEAVAVVIADRILNNLGGDLLELTEATRLDAQIEVQAAIEATKASERVALVASVKDAFARADMRVAVAAERGVYEANTALAVLHELRTAFGAIAPALMEELIPNATEGALRGLSSLHTEEPTISAKLAAMNPSLEGSTR